MAEVELYAKVALAGLASFTSPCVLPLVPAYFAYLAGIALLPAVTDTGGRPDRTAVMTRALALVLGFATVFIVLGDQAAPIGQMVSRHKDALSIGAGAFILLVGLLLMGAPAQLLQWVGGGSVVLWSGTATSIPVAFALGLALCFGWTPCIGPVLSAILKLAAEVPTEGAGVRFLTTYMAGLATGLMATAALVQPLLTQMKRNPAHQRLASLGASVTLTFSGLLLMTDQIGGIGTWMLETFPTLGDLEEAVVGPGLRAAILKQGSP